MRDAPELATTTANTNTTAPIAGAVLQPSALLLMTVVSMIAMML
jgi:hypothetical protein